MKSRSRLLRLITCDLTSLRVRLTIGVAMVSVVGIGSISLWMSMRMQEILISTHKQNLAYIVDRFPRDVEIYSDMVRLETGLQKAIDKITTEDTFVWVKSPQGSIKAQSSPIKKEDQQEFLLTLNQISATPELQKINGRYWLFCRTSLIIKKKNFGQVYVAQDITEDQMMFLSLIKSLSFASLLAIGGMTIVIAWYIKRSLAPLQQISQLTAKISLDHLQEVQIPLENAPSEVKELSQTLAQMLMRLSEAWEHQRQLVSNVSHELRTPLTIVSGYLQSTLRRGTNLTPPQREALEIADSEANRTIQMLQDLLDLARADSGAMHFPLEPLLLKPLLEEIVVMASQYSDRHLQIEIAQESIEIKADRDRLKQVLLNLIDNAVKYSQPESPIIIKLDIWQGQARIQVCDQGIGISLAHQSRIFERFYRVDEARNRSTGGNGLGLSIVKTLVEGMGGNVFVYSQPGKGSTFTVTFPAT